MRSSYKFKSIWRFTQIEHDFIKSKIIGKCYNYFSGESSLGDIKIDIDSNLRPDECLNVIDRDQIDYFTENNETCDTSIIDPPFKLWFKAARLRQVHWLYRIADYTKRRLILVGGYKMFEFGDFKPDLPPYCYIGPSGELKPIYIYNRISNILDITQSL